MVLVPQRAVQQGPKGPIVYVIGIDNKVEIRDVKATDWQTTQWLVEAGLASGEQVVVDNLQRIIPGSLVTPVPIKLAPSLGEAGALKTQAVK